MKKNALNFLLCVVKFIVAVALIVGAEWLLGVPAATDWKEFVSHVAGIVMIYYALAINVFKNELV